MFDFVYINFLCHRQRGSGSRKYPVINGWTPLSFWGSLNAKASIYPACFALQTLLEAPTFLEVLATSSIYEEVNRNEIDAEIFFEKSAEYFVGKSGENFDFSSPEVASVLRQSELMFPLEKPGPATTLKLDARHPETDFWCPDFKRTSLYVVLD